MYVLFKFVKFIKFVVHQVVTLDVLSSGPSEEGMGAEGTHWVAVRSWGGAIVLFHIISARPSKQPLMASTFLKVYMELGSCFLFLKVRINDIISSGQTHDPLPLTLQHITCYLPSSMSSCHSRTPPGPKRLRRSLSMGSADGH